MEQSRPLPGPTARPVNRIVYDSDLGRVCPQCRKSLDQCACARGAAGRGAAPGRASRGKRGAKAGGGGDRPPADGVVRVRREVRRGKPVCVILGMPGTPADLKALAKQLKQTCGSGGSVKDGQIEIQGDHREQIIELLRQRGLVVKLGGG